MNTETVELSPGDAVEYRHKVSTASWHPAQCFGTYRRWMWILQEGASFPHTISVDAFDIRPAPKKSTSELIEEYADKVATEMDLDTLMDEMRFSIIARLEDLPEEDALAAMEYEKCASK